MELTPRMVTVVHAKNLYFNGELIEFVGHNGFPVYDIYLNGEHSWDSSRTITIDLPSSQSGTNTADFISAIPVKYRPLRARDTVIFRVKNGVVLGNSVRSSAFNHNLSTPAKVVLRVDVGGIIAGRGGEVLDSTFTSASGSNAVHSWLPLHIDNRGIIGGGGGSGGIGYVDFAIILGPGGSTLYYRSTVRLLPGGGAGSLAGKGKAAIIVEWKGIVDGPPSLKAGDGSLLSGGSGVVYPSSSYDLIDDAYSGAGGGLGQAGSPGQVAIGGLSLTRDTYSIAGGPAGAAIALSGGGAITYINKGDLRGSAP